MLGADSTLSSRMIANGLLTFSCVTRPKRRAPAALKVMSTTGAAVLVERLLGIDQLVARHHHPALDRDRAGAVGHRQHLAARRGAALRDLGRVGGLVDQLEFEPRGLADQLLQRLGILDARAPGRRSAARPG